MPVRPGSVPAPPCFEIWKGRVVSYIAGPTARKSIGCSSGWVRILATLLLLEFGCRSCGNGRGKSLKVRNGKSRFGPLSFRAFDDLALGATWCQLKYRHRVREPPARRRDGHLVCSQARERAEPWHWNARGQRSVRNSELSGSGPAMSRTSLKSCLSAALFAWKPTTIGRSRSQTWLT